MECDHINRLMSGMVVVQFKRFNVFIRPFSIEQKTIADILAHNAYEEAYFDGVLTQSEMLELMIENEWWSQKQDDEIEKLQKDIEQAKLDYYKNFFIESRRQVIKRALDNMNERIYDLNAEKHMFFDKTCESLTSYVRNIYLLEKFAYINNEKLLDNEVSIYALLKRFFESILSENKIRDIAKGNEWRTIWSCSKNIEGLFTPSANELTSEQVSLLSWSKFYDNVYESIDSPVPEIIKDNIALDGWAIEQNRERELELKKKNGEKLIPANAGEKSEVFIPVRNEQEKREVLALNNPEAQAILRSKNQQINENKKVSESELHHVKSSIQMQCNQMAKHGKG